jgi:hypothetical protein
MLGSNPDRDTGYPEVFMVYLSPSKKIPEQYFD